MKLSTTRSGTDPRLAALLIGLCTALAGASGIPDEAPIQNVRALYQSLKKYN